MTSKPRLLNVPKTPCELRVSYSMADVDVGIPHASRFRSVGISLALEFIGYAGSADGGTKFMVLVVAHGCCDSSSDEIEWKTSCRGWRAPCCVDCDSNDPGPIEDEGDDE